MIDWFRGAVGYTNAVALVYFALLGALQLSLMATAAVGVARRQLHDLSLAGFDRRSSAVTPRVTVIVPAHDEEAVVADTVRAMLTNSYPDLEVIVVNDGSTDGTMAALVAAFDLRPVDRVLPRGRTGAMIRSVLTSERHHGLVVVDAEPSGAKAGALNIGLAMASGELVCAVDADTLADPDAIALLVQPFLEDERVVASGGTIRVVNGCRVVRGRVVEDRPPRGFLGRIQEAEYVRSFVFGRLGWNRLGGNVLISGAFGLFRTDALRAVGGYRTGSVGEDLEVVLALRRWGREHGGPDRIEMVPDAVAWTEVPADHRTLGRQRSRWQAGLMLALWRYRGLIGRPRYGPMGTFVLPCYLVFELLAPVVEVVGLVVIAVGLLTGTLGGPEVAMFAALAYGLALVVGVWALVLDAWVDPGRRSGREWASRAGVLVAEQVGFRQMGVWWRLRGIADALGGAPAWGRQVRSGFGEVTSGPAAVPTVAPAMGVSGSDRGARP